MDNIVITIARQYGSGGKTVGKMVADELGIPFYSRDIIRLASEDSGISEALFGEADEKLKKNPLFKFSKGAYDGALIPPESDDFVLIRTYSIIRLRLSSSWRKKNPVLL